jgi:hypothetical protein
MNQTTRRIIPGATRFAGVHTKRPNIVSRIANPTAALQWVYNAELGRWEQRVTKTH